MRHALNHRARGKEPFGIYFRDDGWPHDDVNETLALTTQLFRDRSGEVQYSDIEVNSGQHQFALRDADKGKDLEAVITHEVGHYIGLAHSPERDSIMTPQNGGCTSARLGPASRGPRGAWSLSFGIALALRLLRRRRPSSSSQHPR